MTIPRITFGMIVLNGEPFIRYTLRALYPHAHEIIVVEGATPGAKNVATPDGHSRDGTLETLYDFKDNEDPDNKLLIITRDGFWSEKDEMSQTYANHATGDYLWQIDVDEFYQPKDISAVIQMLQDDPSITAMSFKTLTFWGSPDYLVDGWYLRRGAEIFHRLFKWGKGYRYITHRPPTIYNAKGQDMRDLHYVDGYEMGKRGIVMYHYALLLPKQVTEKCDYYSHAEWAQRDGALQWAQNAYLRLKQPYRVHNVYDFPSWLERYRGDHPPQILAMWQDISAENSGYDIRQTDDIEQLLNSVQYRIGRQLIIWGNQPALLWKALWRKSKGMLARITPRFIKNFLRSG